MTLSKSDSSPDPAAIETPAPVEATYQLTYRECLRAAWDLSTVSFSEWAWLLVFPLAGVVVAWGIFSNGGSAGLVPRLLLVWCFGFLPCYLPWWAFRLRLGERLVGPQTFRFDKEGLHISSANIDLTRRWSGILRLRWTSRMLYVHPLKNRAHCIPLRAIPADCIERIVELASAGGVSRMDR